MLKKSHLDIMIFVFRERVACSPAFLVEVGDDVLARDRTGIGTEYPYSFIDPCLMMANSTVTHSMTFTACELVKPAMQFGVGFAE